MDTSYNIGCTFHNFTTLDIMKPDGYGSKSIFKEFSKIYRMSEPQFKWILKRFKNFAFNPQTCVVKT